MSDLSEILDRCIDELRAGATLEACLERYPEHRDELEPLLEAAAAVAAMPREQPSRRSMLAVAFRAGHELASTGPGARRARAGAAAVLRFPRPRVLRWAGGLAAAAAVALLVTVSASAGPGSLLYPVKLAKERVTFALTTTPERRVELRLTFASHRLGELVDMASEEGRIDPELLRRLLEEASLALDEARPLPKDRLDLFLARLEAFNRYQQRVLEELEPRVPDAQRPYVRRAIEMCGRRDRWLRDDGGAAAGRPSRKDSGCWDDCGWE